MGYQEADPCEQLRPYLRCIWAIEEDHSRTNNHESATPDSYIEVIFNIGDPCYLQSGSDSRLPDVFLVGLQERPLIFHTTGRTNVIGIRFYTWGVLPFTGLFIPPINSPPIELDADWRALSKTLGDMAQRNTFHELAQFVEAFLLNRFQSALGTDMQIGRAGRHLYETHGQTRIDELATYCNFSKRQLERQFKELAGVSPKKLARSIRFEEIALRLFEDPTANLLDLAYEFGYMDQSHFIHDFKEFAQMTPREFADTMRSLL